MAGNLEILSLLHHRFYAQEVISIHQKEWAWLYQEKKAVPDSFRTYLSSFQEAYLLSAHQPETLMRGLKRAGLVKVLWMPSFPDVEHQTPLEFLQREILGFQHIPWIESEKYVFLAQEDRREARNYLNQHLKIDDNQLLFAIHPGSGSSHKNWPLERFLETAAEIKKRKKVQPIFLIGPVEEETDPILIKTIQAQNFPIIRSLSLPMLAGILSLCQGYLGNDSGISHLAAAVGIPAIVIFGSTDPFFWGPKGQKVRILSSGLQCSPCDRETGQSCQTKECLNLISVQQVLDVVQLLLS